MAAPAPTPAISVPASEYDGFVARCRRAPRRRITNKFAGDDYTTIIYLDGDKLMARDPESGVREVVRTTEDTIKNGTPESYRGMLMKALVTYGVPVEDAFPLAHLIEMAAAAAYRYSVNLLSKSGVTPKPCLRDNIYMAAALIAPDVADRGNWADIPAPELVKMVLDKVMATVAEE